MRIADNGRGITDAQAGDPLSIGLVGMRERAALIGGTFDIVGRRGTGTTVVVRVAMPAAAATRFAARRMRPASERRTAAAARRRR
jgi:nitrate/nitrite-specific signal transduction histidine kinase